MTFNTYTTMSMSKPLSLSLVIISHLLFWFFLIDHSTNVVMYFDIEGVDIPDSYIADGIFSSMFFNALIFYLNHSYLIGKYMVHHSKRYLVIAVTLLILVTICETMADVIQVDAIRFLRSHDVGSTLFLFNLQINVTYWLSSILFKISIDWFNQVKLQKKIESQQIETELALLKSQVHPHFLFNTLNTLYSSAYEFGDAETADGIGKLSHLLRYMLYETKEQKVLLENEIEYLENYIDLQKMRFTNEVTVTFNIKGEITDYTIAPMMLITLVENAFKHGISPAVKTDIVITLTKQNDKLIFQVENNRLRERAKSELEGSSGGLGLVNLKKRLEMIYPQKYTFQTYEKNSKFIARLELI